MSDRRYSWHFSTHIRLFEQGVRGLGVLFEVEEYEHCVFDCNCFFLLSVFNTWGVLFVVWG